MESSIKRAFNSLGRTKKSEFISEHIELASSKAVAKYVEGYLFDVLKDVNDDEYIAMYLREKGYTVTKEVSDDEYVATYLREHTVTK